MGPYTSVMPRFDRFGELERAQRHLEKREPDKPDGSEKPQKVGYGIMALIVVIAGAGFSQVQGIGTTVLFFFSVLGIILGGIGVSRKDTKGCAIAAIVLGAFFLTIFLSLGFAFVATA